MLKPTFVSTMEELEQIHLLNQQNLKYHLSEAEKQEEGFVSWLYPLELLQQMHQLAPSIIVKDNSAVVGYALTTLPEAAVFHADLKALFDNLEMLSYKGKPLFEHHFYCMGQICVAKPYRGQGIVKMLYDMHKEQFSPTYDFLLTEIATRNVRSWKAHEKMGFKTIHTHTDVLDEWNVVVWDWYSE